MKFEPDKNKRGVLSTNWWLENCAIIFFSDLNFFRGLDEIFSWATFGLWDAY